MKNQYERDLTEESVPLIIKSIDKSSIAQEAGLEAGDRILAVNEEVLSDELDFYYQTAFEEFTITVEKKDSSIWEIEIEKDSSEDLGITLNDSLKTKTCSNRCLFCFIDQMPEGMRTSLYVKDDDERLSFINGNYVTLTNLSEKDMERICRWKLPINVSVHTTDPFLRRKMLGNKRAGEILQQLKRLSDNGVEMNAQIVLVPELNDKTLVSTLYDLKPFFPNLKSVSVVPVGKTRYRDKLYKIRTFSRKEAEVIIDTVSQIQKEFQESFNTPFVFLSDEFYLLAGREVPKEEHYGRFEQLENGVGMVRSFISDFKNALEDDPGETSEKKLLIITGKLFEPVLRELIEDFSKKYPGIQVGILGVTNHFFGQEITVSGLLTGRDILDSLEETDLSQVEEVILPASLLKNGTELLLDDTTVTEIAEKINRKVTIVEADGRSLVEKLTE